MPKVGKTLKQRLEEKFYVTPGCWIWTGAKNTKGYGVIKVGDKTVRAHRLSYSLYKAPIKEGAILLHSCDIPACVNPEHLSEGTLEENQKDKENKGRVPKGERHYKSSLSSEEVRQIRDLLRSKMFLIREIADFYDVSRDVITNIKLGRSRRKG